MFDRLFETQASSTVNLSPNVLVKSSISSVLFCVHTATNNVLKLTHKSDICTRALFSEPAREV